MRSVMSKDKRKDRPKPPQRQPIEERSSPELRSLIETHNALTPGNWSVGLAVKNKYGHESALAKHVEKVFAEHGRGQEMAYRAVMSFPARGYADIATKLEFARVALLHLRAPNTIIDVINDAKRLDKATPPETADQELLERVSACEAAMAVHRALSEQFDAERAKAEKAADAAGYREMQGYATGEAWRARNNIIDQVRPPASFDRWNSAHKEIGRTAKAVFAMKPKTLRGAVAKLRLVVALIKADDLDTWEGDRDWLTETLADLERIEAAK